MRRAVLLSCFLSACNPVLDPVVTQQPQALTSTTRAPRVVWVLDKSGSLDMPVDPLAAACQPPCGPGGSVACPPECVTWKRALDAFLESLASQMAPARHGALIYPSDNFCGPPRDFAVPLPPLASPTGFSDVLTKYTRSYPGGGTPTRAALELVESLPDEADTESYLVLVTDGKPNCNANNPNNTCAAHNPLCRCTTVTCGIANNLCTLGCLDDTVAETSRRLAQRGWNLLVVAIADASTGDGDALLSSMQIGLPQTCSSEADCTGCADGLCPKRYYPVRTAADFARPERRIADVVQVYGRCSWWLGQDVQAAELSVTLGGVDVPRADWELSGTRRVMIGGEACRRLIGDAHLAPVILWSPGSG